MELMYLLLSDYNFVGAKISETMYQMLEAQ